MEHSITLLTPIAPYNFSLTASYPTHFAGRYSADYFQNGTLMRLLDLKDRFCLVRASSTGTLDTPCLKVEFTATDLDDAIVAKAHRQAATWLGVSQDLTIFYRKAYGDPLLGPLVQGLKGMHVPQTASVFAAVQSGGISESFPHVSEFHAQGRGILNRISLFIMTS